LAGNRSVVGISRLRQNTVNIYISTSYYRALRSCDS